VTAAVERSPGLPVEIGQIDRELGRLWEESGDNKARASLINLAVYSEDPAAVGPNTDLIAAIAGHHACRAILITADPAAPASGARAWISAHCHSNGKGGSEICSEQISFELRGDACWALPNIVFSHLESDLPLCFWWQAEFREPLDEQLWGWVDRLLFDSQGWSDPLTQFALARKIGGIRGTGTVLCDLNWARLLSARFALANFFDHAAAAAHLREIESVEIEHAPGARITALLFLGWLASQLDWSLHELLSERGFIAPDGRHIRFTLREKPGACIGLCVLGSPGARFTFSREAGTEFYHAEMKAGDCNVSHLLNAGRDRMQDILLTELGRSARHPLYARAVAIVEALLA